MSAQRRDSGGAGAAGCEDSGPAGVGPLEFREHKVDAQVAGTGPLLHQPPLRLFGCSPRFAPGGRALKTGHRCVYRSHQRQHGQAGQHPLALLTRWAIAAVRILQEAQRETLPRPSLCPRVPESQTGTATASTAADLSAARRCDANIIIRLCRCICCHASAIVG